MQATELPSNKNFAGKTVLKKTFVYTNQDEFAYTGKSTYGVGCKLCPLGHYMYHNMLPQERRQQIVSYVHKASEINKWL